MRPWRNMCYFRKQNSYEMLPMVYSTRVGCKIYRPSCEGQLRRAIFDVRCQNAVEPWYKVPSLYTLLSLFSLSSFLLTVFVLRVLSSYVYLFILFVFVVPYVYLLYCVYIAVLTLDAACWLEVSIRKVLRPPTSTQVFLSFPVSISECWDGSQVSKLLLHASHVALST